MKTTYMDVNKNPIEFIGKITVEIEDAEDGLPLHITKENIRPLLGLDWMKGLEMEIQFKNTVNGIAEQNENTEDLEKEIKEKFRKLFKDNHTIKGTEVDIELKPGTKIIQQKARPIPIHLQKHVETELKRLIESGHIEKA